MGTTTLEEKIRVRAQEEWRNKVDKAFSALHDALGTRHNYTKTKVKSDRGHQLSVCDLVSTTQDNIIDALSKEFEDKAVNDFITKVERLQEQLDALNIDNQ